MRIVIRTDAGPSIGGGHLMRSLTLAEAARERGHDVSFVCVDDPMVDRVAAKGFGMVRLVPGTGKLADAEATGRAADRADWLVWDHYGLDTSWLAATRLAAAITLRVMAVDDLDFGPLHSDLVLDQTRIGAPRIHRSPAEMVGPAFALLRPEFADLRERSLGRRGGPVKKVLIAPGMMDAAGLAPSALDALDRLPGLAAEVVMSSSSQSRAAVEARVEGRDDRVLTLDATDMADRLLVADFCIGACGMTTWERCCLGVPSVVVAVADNQSHVAASLAHYGAASVIPLVEASDPSRLAEVLRHAIQVAPGMAGAAAALCDGLGTSRVLDALEARLRPLERDDAKRLYEWRLRPEIRSSSHNRESFSWEAHLEWIERTLTRRDGLWRMYEEGRPRGFVAAVGEAHGAWRWSFYIGDPGAAPGAGGRMLSAMLRELWATTDADAVEGEVLANNTVSAALHRRLGFTEVASERPGVLVFRLDRSQDVAGPSGKGS